MKSTPCVWSWLLTFRGQLLVLIRDHVATQGELIYLGLLPAQIEDSDLGIYTKKLRKKMSKSFEIVLSPTHFRDLNEMD